MRIVIRVPQVLVLVALLAFGSVGLAVIAQYQFDMQPCVWCVLQRLIFLVIGVLALLAAVTGGAVRRIASGLGVLAALSGIASALWQQLVAVHLPSCDLTLADRIIHLFHLDRLAPSLFIAYASCGEAAVNVLGIPFAYWSCAMFVLLALLLMWTLRTSMRAVRTR
jgi:disulfide bond formation protein DsbB